MTRHSIYIFLLVFLVIFGALTFADTQRDECQRLQGIYSDRKLAESKADHLGFYTAQQELFAINLVDTLVWPRNVVGCDLKL